LVNASELRKTVFNVGDWRRVMSHARGGGEGKKLKCPAQFS